METCKKLDGHQPYVIMTSIQSSHIPTLIYEPLKTKKYFTENP
jgi:hypothetical protein